MKLLELYSLASGLKIGKQYLAEDFFPLPFERYITIQASSGMAGKNYAYYNEVLRLLRDVLIREKIHVIQLGSADDIYLEGTVNLLGKTSLAQSNFVLSRSMLHIGNDSVLQHRAGYVGVPLITLFGPTSAANHSAHSFNKDKTAFIESHRNGRKPSFQADENPRTINYIKPEDVAKHAIRFLGLTDEIKVETVYIGPQYGPNIFDVVPDACIPGDFVPHVPAIIRMDWLHDEAGLERQLSVRKCHISMNKEINLSLLSRLIPNVLGINYLVDESTSVEYLAALKKLGGRQAYFSHETNQKKLDDLRFKFFDIAPVEWEGIKTKDDFFKESKVYLNKELDPSIKVDTLSYTSTKLTFSKDKAYSSKADWLAGKPTDIQNATSTVIDTPDFWRDFQHYHVYSRL